MINALVRKFSSSCLSNTELQYCTSFEVYAAHHLRVTDTVVDLDAAGTRISDTTLWEPDDERPLPSKKGRPTADDHECPLSSKDRPRDDDDERPLPSKKRARDDDDDPTFDSPRPFKKLKLAEKPSTHNSKREFACPFWKFDPYSHPRCIACRLGRIRDVKQHLSRQHHPLFYCPRCFRVFDANIELQNHLQADEYCSPAREQHPPFLTTEQSWLLARRSDPKVPAEESWFRIYDMLFPGQHRPLSGFVDKPPWSSEIDKFRSFCTFSGPGIIQDALSRFEHDSDIMSIASLTTTITPAIMTAAFDQLTSRWISQRFPSHSSRDSGLGSSSDSRLSGSKLARDGTPCPSDSSGFGGKETCFKVKNVRDS